MRKTTILLLLAVLFMPATVFAQFGKNQVIWEDAIWNFYRSSHFDFYISLDVKDENIQQHLSGLVTHLEGSYGFLSSKLGHDLKNRPIVVVSRTHSTFEALHIGGEDFMPEGVGAYALPRGSRLLPNTELLLAIKPDFLPVLNRTIYTHELVHIFQFDMIGWSFIGKGEGASVERWLFEATADYLANKYAPYSRDDIRRMQQRTAAANVKNPQMGLPTLKMLSDGQANPYSLGSMPFMFLENRYGESPVMNMIGAIFNQRGQKFIELLADISQGEFYSAEAFDRAHRDYWSDRYAKDSLERPKPYQETPSVKGRQVVKESHPYPLTSPTISPDGKQIAALTINRKNGIVLAVVRMPDRDESPYVPFSKRRKFWLFGSRVAVTKSSLKILTTFMPPKHYEYIVAQELNVWPFNGSDMDWWQDKEWSAKIQNTESAAKEARKAFVEFKQTPQNKKAPDHENKIVEQEKNIESLDKKMAELREVGSVSKIAFFARLNKDHALFIIDANTGKFLEKIELDLDQAFSPNFSPDGRTIYFSAAKNIQRDIYSINLETREIKNLTNGGVFNSAPKVSPNGTELVYVAFVGGYQKIFHLDINSGRKTQLTYGRWNDNSPAWSSDRTKLVYASDEKDGIWNLYTYESGENSYESKQWTEFYGGVFTPSFVPGENDRIVYSAYLEDDQVGNYVFPNFEIFEARLREPLRISKIELDKKENMELSFRSENAIAEQLDSRQFENPQNPPPRWKLYGSEINFGTSSWFGMFAFSRLAVQDLLANRTHMGIYAQRNEFRYIDYVYLDRSKGRGWAASFNHTQFPFYFVTRNLQGEYPRYSEPDGDSDQFVLNNTWVKETSARLYVEYPFNKWSRVEFAIQPRWRTYFLPLSDADIEYFGNQIPEIDRQFYDFFKDSNGRVNLGFSTAYVRDTVLYSNFGPFNGNALRAQVDYGPGLSNGSAPYTTFQIDARRYMRLSEASLFALNFAGLASTRANGDMMIMGGTERLRTYPYFSVAGNQVGYGSAEVRFPLADVVLLGAVPFQLRGALFGDYAVAKFSSDVFLPRREWSYGFGLQADLFMPMHFEWAKTRFSPNKWNFNFRIGLNF